MKIGIGLPIRGGTDLRHDITTMATEAEKAGAASVWVYERILWPVTPAQGMYGVPGLPWAEAYSEAADSLTVLTVAAAVTTGVRIGTSVLVAPFYSPLHLARALATVDQVSGGRVVAGLGTGWSTDEYTAIASDFDHRGRALDEMMEACRAMWAEGPTTYSDSRITVDNAFVRPKPASTIPLMLGGGASNKAIRRIAERGDGWLPANTPPAAVRQTWDQIRELATEAGRDASTLELIPRGNVVLTDAPLGADRYPFMGTWDQVVEDVVATAEAGADEFVLDLFMSATSGKDQIDKTLEGFDRLKAAGLGI